MFFICIFSKAKSKDLKMCYQKSLYQSEINLTKYIKKPPVEKDILEPYHLNDGFAHNTIYILPMDEPGHWYPAKWGLVPSFADAETFYKEGKYNTLNARDDKVFDSRLYSGPIRESRCLVFADGFFEPHHIGKQSQPYFCYLENSTDFYSRDIFCFAGIYNKDNKGIYSVSLITVKANPLFEKVHNKARRMPLVLDRELETEWVSAAQPDPVIKDLMKDGFTSKSFRAHPVINYRLKVNRELKDTSKVVEPVEALDPFLEL
ncbi:SOS response-associated peptidase [Gramella sp. BOM4]|nr:SOS response-associated peptidase [Christiangramia bathymodioli]